jgi:hypothetical protein
MTIQIIDGADATTANVDSLPKGLGVVAGYATGPDVAWTRAQFAEYPDAIIIDQDPAATDPMADVLDYEAGAATLDHLAPWARAALADWRAGVRPGQRSPAIYASQSKLTDVANALAAGGVSGIGLWIANWSEGRAAAVQQIEAAGGPFPVIGVQWADAGTHDLDVFSGPWVNARSSRAVVAAPPGQWHDPKAWTWQAATIVGIGQNGKLCAFEYRDGAPWARIT